MNSGLRNYALVTGAYWAQTLTDGALRMLVLLHFNRLGYTPLQIASLFLFYEFFGIVTNLVGGWIAARLGLKVTLFAGLAVQVAALSMLAMLNPLWSAALSVAYVMASQALSGIAKDLTKMSSKSAIKAVVPADAKEGSLYKWVAILTGSKNALKGVGFFLGGALLAGLGFAPALWTMAGALVLTLLGCVLALPPDIGRAKEKVGFRGMFSMSRAVNVLSAARFFLFGARDVWFVVGLPVFLADRLGWNFYQVGGFLAAWVIGYGFVQASAPAAHAGTRRRRAFAGRGGGGVLDVPSGCRARADGPGALASGKPRGGGRRGAGGLRHRLCHQLGGPQLSHSRVLGRRQGGTQRRLLLHGQRGRTTRRDGALGLAVPTRGPGRMPVGLGGPGAGCRLSFHCCFPRAAPRSI